MLTHLRRTIDTDVGGQLAMFVLGSMLALAIPLAAFAFCLDWRGQGPFFAALRNLP
jgi:hypothetical protein